jgi:polyphosphate glucokinase
MCLAAALSAAAIAGELRPRAPHRASARTEQECPLAGDRRVRDERIPLLHVLAVDVGGSHVKAVLQGERETRRFKSSAHLTAAEMVKRTIRLVSGWRFDHVSLGVPAQVVHGQVVHEPMNLGHGWWVGFDFESAFDRPTKVINDAVMQAIGSYEGGRMLFLGLGTGLGSAFIVDGKIEPMELGHLPYRKRTFEDYVGYAGWKRLGRQRWREAVLDTIERLSTAIEAESVVVGGGLAKELEAVPANVRIGSNELAFVGGFRLWNDQLSPSGRVDQRNANAATPRALTFMPMIGRVQVLPLACRAPVLPGLSPVCAL